MRGGEGSGRRVSGSKASNNEGVTKRPGRNNGVCTYSHGRVVVGAGPTTTFKREALVGSDCFAVVVCLAVDSFAAHLGLEFPQDLWTKDLPAKDRTPTTNR